MGKKIAEKIKEKKEENNGCWIDRRNKCLFHQVMRGFIDASPRCGKCQHFDKEEFISNYYSVIYPME